MKNERLGLFIKGRRLKMGFNRPQFSEITCVDADYLNNIEQGRVPSTRSLIQIASGLGIRPGVLLDVLAGFEGNFAEINSINSIQLPEILVNEPGDRKEIEEFIRFKAQIRLEANTRHNNDLINEALNTLSHQGNTDQGEVSEL